MRTTNTFRRCQLGWPALVLLAACAGAPPDADTLTPEEQARFTQLIELRGFAAESVVFEGDQAILDGDISFDVREALRESEAVRDKAYYQSDLVDPAVLGQVVVTETVDPEIALSPEWSLAAQTAVQRWNDAASWQRFHLTWLPAAEAEAARAEGRPVIEFKMMGSQKNAFARSAYPSGGQPASFVGINYNYQGPDCQGGETTDIETVPFEQKVKTSAHELGHAFGFVHPGLGTLVVPGTASVEHDDAGDAIMSYASLMWPGCIDGEFVVSSPSADDVAAMRVFESGEL